MKKSICIISLSNIAHDSRVMRQIEYLGKDHHITVIGYGPPPEKFENNDCIHWREIPLPKQTTLHTLSKLFTRLCAIPFFPKSHPACHLAMENRCDIYHANNWDALPFAALAARENDARLVLDLHESYDSWYWGVAAPLIKFVLRKYAPEVDASTTVVKPLAEQHQQFGLDPIVIRNIPPLPESSGVIHHTDPNKIHLIHHGIASRARSTDLMIRTLALCDARYELHLAFMNFQSTYAANLRSLAEEIAPGRVTFHKPYPSDAIVHEITKYDIGFFPLPPKSYNYLIALPNKLFEFIAAGLAVCIGPSPSMEAIVNQYQCGKVAPSFEPGVIAEQLNQTTAADWDRMKQASRAATKELNANIEMQKLLDLYAEL